MTTTLATRPAPITTGARIVLSNGWTVSVAPGTLAGFWSVAAWPTADRGIGNHRWFDFGGGRRDLKIFCIAELLPLIDQVAKAPVPVPR